jgi:hypothetical protein
MMIQLLSKDHYDRGREESRTDMLNRLEVVGVAVGKWEAVYRIKPVIHDFLHQIAPRLPPSLLGRPLTLLFFLPEFAGQDYTRFGL